MVGFVEAATSAIRSAYCAQVNGSPQWWANLREVLLPGDLIRRGDALNRWVCNGGDTPDLPPGQFEGGQCEDVLYRAIGTVTWDIFVGATGATSSASQEVATELILRGPVSGYRVELSNPGPNGPRTFTFIWDTSVGEVSSFSTTNPITLNSVSNVQFSGALTDATGSPGDCGDPDPILPEPGSINVETNINYTDNSDNSINLTVPIVFGLFYFDVNGSLNIPFTLDLGGFEWSGDLKLFPDTEVVIKPPGDDGGGGNPDNPDPTPGDPPNDGDEPPLGPVETIVALVVRSQPTTGDRQTLIPDPKGPNILAPGIGTVRFAIRAGQVTAWTADIRIKGVNEWIPVPWPRGAVDFSVRWETGWTGEATAIRGRPPQTN